MGADSVNFRSDLNKLTDYQTSGSATGMKARDLPSSVTTVSRATSPGNTVALQFTWARA